MQSDESTGRSFAWLNTTQFFGALNDNFSKQVLVIALTAGAGMGLNNAVARTTIVFALPFLLFLPAAGILADRFSKSAVIVRAKWLEVAAMALNLVALLALAAAPGPATVLLFVVLFAMCTQSAVFSPAKYGVIRELVPDGDLSKANGLLQAFTFLAIIAGIVVAPALSGLGRELGMQYPLLGVSCVVFAALGLGASLRIRRTAPVGTDERISLLLVRDVWSTMRSIRRDRNLTGAVYGAAAFSMVAAFLQGYVLIYSQHYLFPVGENPSQDELSESMEKGLYLFVAAALGIGLGAYAAGTLSRHTIEFGIVPLGGGLLALGTLAFAVVPPSVPLAVMALLVAGIGGGLFIVPLEAFIQHRSPPERRGQVLAASAWIGWVGIALAAGVIKLFGMLELSPRTGFLLVGLVTIGLAVVALRILPDFFTRFVVLVVTRVVYRIRVSGLDNVPRDGGALLVCNHASWIDALVVLATQQRRVRFLMSKAMLKKFGWMRFFARLLHVIPVSNADSAAGIRQSLDEARAALDEGYLVCIFAEGHISRTGMMFGFKSGLERILKDSGHPVIPMYVGGAWGSITSYAHGRLFSRWPLRVPYPVSLLYGEPMPARSRAWEVRQQVMELSVEYFEQRRPQRKPLMWYVVQVARRHPRREAMTDTLTRKRLSFRRALIGTLALAPVLERETRGAKMVGVLLPPSIAGCLVNLALCLRGKVAVNLNPTAGPDAIAYAVRHCGLETVITARKLLERFPGLPLPEHQLHIEEVLPTIGAAAKARAALAAVCAPANWLCRTRRFSPDDLCTVIFSSGSTGTPKGVMLSHHNVASNVESAISLLQPTEEDRLCMALPLFHSLGYTVGVWFPLIGGFGVDYHANPLETGKLAALIAKERSTMYMTTPTFLQAFTRKADPEQLQSLRYCLTGSEKLKRAIGEAFEEKFGLTPLEGYGTTECAPIVSVNVPNVTIDGVRQVGHKAGSIGQPVPGVAVKIADLDTGEALPPGESGRLLVKGPNIMLGYLGQPDLTAEVLRDGWYDTGDMGFIDRDGFVTITDRIARFSKVGGEMVPHIGVEERLLELLDTIEPVLVVTAVNHESKGEQLVVLHTDAVDVAALQERVAGCDLPNLWKPNRRNYIPVEEIPILGSGKLDLKRVRKLAEELMGSALRPE